MFQRYYQKFLFKSVYLQGLFVVLFWLIISAGFYSFFFEAVWEKLKRQALENQRLEKTLQKEKERNAMLKNRKIDFPVDDKIDRYFHLPSDYREASFLMDSMAKLATGKASPVLKQISLKNEKTEDNHRIFLIHLSLLGNYQELIAFCFLIQEQPFFMQLERFAIEKLESNTRGGYALYADLFIHLYIFN